jgi:hypothetical protein
LFLFQAIPYNKNHKNMKKILSALLLVSAFVSCKKTDSNLNNCAANESTIPGTYTLEAMTYKASAAAAAEDQFSLMAACQKDDTYTFAADGGILVTDAGVSCGMPPMPSQGWGLENSNANLRLGDDIYVIESFDCTRLVVSKANILVDGDKETRTYLKQ